MDLGFILLITVILLTILMLLKSIGYVKNIQAKGKENPTGITKYGRDIAIGIVSGAVVLIVDRIITLMFDGSSKSNIFSQQNIWAFLGSLFSLLVYSLFDIALIFFLILYIITKGLGAAKIQT